MKPPTKPSRPWFKKQRQRETPKKVVVMVERWTVRAYGRQMAVCKKEADALRIVEEYGMLDVPATVTPSRLRVAS